MVERLREAIERARRERERHIGQGAEHAPEPPPPAEAPAARPATPWRDLTPAEPDADVLRRGRIVTADKSDPASAVFDMTRTRILKTCQRNGWRRVGFTSPSKHCGKTFVTLNLAFSFARNPELRCVVVDLDLQRPTIAAVLRQKADGDVADFLAGRVALADAVRALRPNLAALFAVPTANSAELLQNPRTADALDAMQSALDPDILLFDLPPVFAGDDVISIAGALDAIVLVASAQHTTAREVLDAERMLGDSAAFLGVVLNKIEPRDADAFDYGYAAQDVA